MGRKIVPADAPNGVINDGNIKFNKQELLDILVHKGRFDLAQEVGNVMQELENPNNEERKEVHDFSFFYSFFFFLSYFFAIYARCVYLDFRNKIFFVVSELNSRKAKLLPPNPQICVRPN